MGKGAVIAIVIIAAVLIIGSVGFIVWNNSNHNSGGGSIDVSGGESGQGLSFEENQESTGKVIQGIAMPGYETVEIAANTRDVTVDFYNPEENEGKYHLTFELVVNGETLYKSGLVKAGDHQRNITLSHGLEPGTYTAKLNIQPYTADDKLSSKNGGCVTFKLVAVDV